MKIYKCLISNINNIIEAQGSYHLDINNDNRIISYCIKFKDYMIELKTGNFYPILESDFSFEIDIRLVNEIDPYEFYVVRYEESNIEKEQHAFYYKEKAKILYKKYNKKM